MSSVPADVIVDLHRLFRRLNVGWYVFGAQAAAMHGAARLTVDVGVTVALGEVSTKALARALMSEGFDLRITDDEFVERTRVLPAVHSTSGIPVDIVLAGPGIEELFLARAQRRDIRGIKVPVACPEDIAVMKILAGRVKDIDDVLAIVRATGNDFRRKLARETLDLLEQALDRRDLLAPARTGLQRRCLSDYPEQAEARREDPEGRGSTQALCEAFSTESIEEGPLAPVRPFDSWPLASSGSTRRSSTRKSRPLECCPRASRQWPSRASGDSRRRRCRRPR
jgi:hypothetical protein